MPIIDLLLAVITSTGKSYACMYMYVYACMYVSLLYYRPGRGGGGGGGGRQGDCRRMLAPLSSPQATPPFSFYLSMMGMLL